MSSPRKDGLIGRHDPTEVATMDDAATRHADEFLAMALLEQQQRANELGGERGTCRNCGERCLPLAVYCDADCRDDHERVLAAQRRQGRATE